MTYIYDVLLNFTEERLIEFYEWNQTDIIENIKKIPIFRISSNQLNDLLSYNIKLDKQILAKIKNQTSTYKRTTDLEYTALFTDLNKVVGIEFNREGNILCRSGLLLDEEEDIIDECSVEIVETIKYEKKEPLEKNNFYTREEIRKRRYILKELELVYKEKDKDKLNYLYQEVYGKSRISFENKYLKLKNELEKNYSSKFNSIYEIFKLIYTKNRVCKKICVNDIYP